MKSAVLHIVIQFLSPELVLYPSISVCLQPKKDAFDTRTVTADAAEKFPSVVSFPNHPLLEAKMTTWDDQLIAQGARSGLRWLNFEQGDIAGNETLESIVDTWVAFAVDLDNASNTMAWQCLTVHPPTKSKPGISHQVQS